MPNNTHETLPISTLILILNETNKPINDKYMLALFIIRYENLAKTYHIDKFNNSINILTEQESYTILQKNNYLFINDKWKFNNIAEQIALDLKDL